MKYEIWMMCTMGECEPLEPFAKEYEGDDIEEAMAALDKLRFVSQKKYGTNEIIYQLYTT